MDDHVVELCYSRCRANAREWIERVFILLLDRPQLRLSVRARELCVALVSLVMKKKIDSLRGNDYFTMWTRAHLDELRTLVATKLSAYRRGAGDLSENRRTHT